MKKNSSPVEISVVIPVYCSAEILPVLYRRLTSVMQDLRRAYEVIFVDDGSRDGSWSVLAGFTGPDPRIKALQMMRNVGQGHATLCGLAVAEGAIVVTLDDDLQHPPEEIPRLLSELETNGELDVILGLPACRRHNSFRNLGSWILNQINSRLLGRSKTQPFSGFRAMRAAVVRQLVQLPCFQSAIGPLIYSVSDRIGSITVKHDRRLRGKSGYTWTRLAAQVLNNLISFSFFPLRVLVFLGAVGMALSLVGGVYFLFHYFSGVIKVPGWTSIILILLWLAGFISFASGIIGEYLVRIYQRVSQGSGFMVRRSLPAGLESGDRATDRN